MSREDAQNSSSSFFFKNREIKLFFKIYFIEVQLTEFAFLVFSGNTDAAGSGTML